MSIRKLKIIKRLFFTIALVSSVLSFVFLEMKTRKMSISEEIKGR